MKKRIFAIAGVLVSSLLLSSVPSVAQNQSARPMPGMWRFNTTAVGLFRDSDDHCLSQAEVDRFYANPCKRNSVCVYKTKEIQADGDVIFDGTWTDRKRRVTKIKATGRLASTQMTLRGNAAQFGLPIPFSFTATRIAAVCR